LKTKQHVTDAGADDSTLTCDVIIESPLNCFASYRVHGALEDQDPSNVSNYEHVWIDVNAFDTNK